MSARPEPLTVATLDALPAAEATELLQSCCGAHAWVRAMLDRRPFGSLGRVLAGAEEIWWSLTPEDWREAFSHHPRIGERGSAAASGTRERAWSADEQRGATAADRAVRAALAEGNREYERRFGHIYVVCATGRTADELLAILRQRLTNDAATELRNAAAEQATITEIRLRKLFAPAPPSSTSPA